MTGPGIRRLRPHRGWLSPRLLALVGILVSVGFGYLAVRGVHWSDTWAALRSTDYEWLVPALALMTVAFFIRVERWRVMFHPRRPAFRPLARALFVGYRLNMRVTLSPRGAAS